MIHRGGRHDHAAGGRGLQGFREFAVSQKGNRGGVGHGQWSDGGDGSLAASQDCAADPVAQLGDRHGGQAIEEPRVGHQASPDPGPIGPVAGPAPPCG